MTMRIVKHPTIEGMSLFGDDVDYFFNYLDDLQESNRLNMFGAPNEVIGVCPDMKLDEAIWIVSMWAAYKETGVMPC